MKVGDLVARSMRIIRVLDPNEAPEATDYETAIVALNSMVRRFEANGMTLGWSDVSDPDDTLPVPPEAEEAIAFNLAIAISMEYTDNISPVVVAKAQEGLAQLRRDVAVANPLGWDRGCGRYNVRTDAYDKYGF